MLDYFVTNHAPEVDACTIRAFIEDQAILAENITINIWREENGSVHVHTEDSDGNLTDLVLGEESVTEKL